MRIAFFLLGLAACLPNTELVVTKSGAGSGTVTSDPLGINCGDQCTMSMDAEGVIELTATPADGDTFRGWTGDCTGVGPCVIDSSYNAEVDARFEKVATVTVRSTGAPIGFTVMSTPPGIVCSGTTCAGEFAVGTDVTLDLSLVPMFHFDGWSGACSGVGTRCTVHVADAVDTEATFRPIVALNLRASGMGHVVAGSVSCAQADCVALVPQGDTVQLFAVKEFTASQVLWGGDCGSVVGDTCTLTMNAMHTAVATFQ